MSAEFLKSMSHGDLSALAMKIMVDLNARRHDEVPGELASKAGADQGTMYNVCVTLISGGFWSDLITDLAEWLEMWMDSSKKGCVIRWILAISSSDHRQQALGRAKIYLIMQFKSFPLTRFRKASA